MSITDVSICNDALIEIGLERIISLEDTSKRAILCKEQYPKVRDYVLVSHPWIFSLKRVALAQIDEDVVYGYTYQYQLPSNALGVTEVENSPEYKIEGDRLLTDASSINCKIIQRIVDTNKYTPNFAFAVAYLLAAKLCYPLTGSREMVNDLRQMYSAVIRDARSIDAQRMGSPDNFVFDEFLNARF